MRDRLWVRSIYESAAAGHELHYIVANDALCKKRIAERNRTRPEGIYWGDVSEEMFDAVNAYFQPPAPEEGFLVVEHDAEREMRD